MEIEIVTTRELQETLAPILAEVQGIRERMDRLEQMKLARRERLITKREAARTLGVSAAKLRALLATSGIKTAVTPGGREKVLEASLNKYIEELAGKGETA